MNETAPLPNFTVTETKLEMCVLDCLLVKRGNYVLPQYAANASNLYESLKPGDVIIQPHQIERGDFICDSNWNPELRWVRLLDERDIGPDGQPLSKLRNKGWVEDLRPDLHPKEGWQR